MALAGKVCALPGCSVIFPIREFSYRLGDHPGEYCSSRCVRIAFDLMKRGKPYTKGNFPVYTEPRYAEPNSRHVKGANEANEKEQNVKVKAEDFGDAGIIRRFCDAEGCNNPIALSWRGRSGEYCSNACLQKEKKEKSTFMTAANTTVDDDDEVTDNEEEENGNGENGDEEDAPPIRRGSAAKKAVGKKAAPAKKGKGPVAAAPAKKAAASSNSVGHGTYADDAVITVRKRDHTLKGKRGESLDLLLKKDSTTVAKFKTALEQKDLKSYAGFAIKTAVDNKLITIKT